MTLSIEITTETDTADSVELAGVFLELAKKNARFWKWFVFSVHAAVQNIFTLLLRNGNGYQVQKPKVMVKMIESDASGGTQVEQSMDFFLKLYDKVLVKENLRSDTQPLPNNQDRPALESLNNIRNEYAHFNAKTWLLEVALIKARSLTSLKVIEHYLLQQQAVLWHDRAAYKRTLVGMERLLESLTRCQEKGGLSYAANRPRLGG